MSKTTSFKILVDPGVPSFDETAIGDNYFNISYKPASFDQQERQPVGTTFAVEYKEQGADDWKEVPQHGKFIISLQNLSRIFQTMT